MVEQTDSTSQICKREDCTLAKDGKCIEGVSVSDCINVQHSELSSGEIEQEPKPTQEPSTTARPIDHQLHPAEELNDEDANAITRDRLTKLIIVAGLPKAGKTTLLVSLYRSLLAGPFANYNFAGSLTLHGWELRGHLSSLVSDQVKPDTERTLGMSYLHLRLKSCNGDGSPQDMLFTDITGERFRDIRDSAQDCREMDLLKRADHFVLVLDGLSLCSQSERHITYHNAEMILNMCVDNYMLGGRSLVDILFTKYDLFKSKESDNEHARFLALIETELRKKYESKLGRLRFFKTAGRENPGENVPLAFGLDKVVPSWVEESPTLIFPSPIRFGHSNLISEFDKFLMKHNPEFVDED